MTEPKAKPKVKTEGKAPANSKGTKQERSPEEIREDIGQTREELGDTAAALAAKADVKGQARAKVDELKQTAQQRKEELTDKARDAGSKAKEATPESIGAGASSVVSSAQENPVPLAVVAAFVGGLAIGWILGR